MRADDAVRAGEVDVLEDAEGAAIALQRLEAADAAGGDLDDLAGVDLAQEGGAQVVEGAALGGDDPAAVQAPQAERSHAEGVAHGEQGVGREDDEGVGALDASHHVGEALRPGASGREGEDAGHDLGVGRRRELVALLLQVGAQRLGVDEVAVVAERDLAVGAGDAERLGVLQAAGAGRRVAGVADGDVAAEVAEVLFVEDLGDEAHAEVAVELMTVGCDDSRALLASMLERVQAVEGHSCRVFVGGVDAEDAAVLPGTGAHLPPALKPPYPRRTDREMIVRGRWGRKLGRRRSAARATYDRSICIWRDQICAQSEHRRLHLRLRSRMIPLEPTDFRYCSRYSELCPWGVGRSATRAAREYGFRFRDQRG